MITKTEEDMDLRKIAESGQVFRAKECRPGLYRFVHRNFALFISKKAPGMFEVSCTPKEWEKVWIPYFDLDEKYDIDTDAFSNPYIRKAVQAGHGIRILRQDPWECLISFIISQRKNIPAISSCVEKMSEERGENIETSMGTVKAFPKPGELRGDLSLFKLGYREDYVRGAAEEVADGELDLSSLSKLADSELKSKLKEVRGVGEKIANCVSLFAYHRTACAPVDVWIEKIIKDWFGGENPFPSLGEKAGIIQQYLYFYARSI
ncbi:MAG: DNA glycosylase [Aeriscardovia sp.]|nr:DNA glycosylase [Aeriscardovia sp.]